MDNSNENGLGWEGVPSFDGAFEQSPSPEATPTPDNNPTPTQSPTPQVIPQPTINFDKVEKTETPTWQGATVTQKFGNPNRRLYGKNGHLGTDFRISPNTPIATPNGEWAVKSVSKNYKGSLYGNSVLIQNKDNKETLRFSHLNTINVKPGQVVDQGDVLGKSGSTGRSTGPHLDVEFVDAKGRMGDVTKSDVFNRTQNPPKEKLPTIPQLVPSLRGTPNDLGW